MDGYAVRGLDAQNASETNPVELRIVGKSRIGRIYKQPLETGQAVEVATGSSIPPGADTVVRVEQTKRIPPSGVAILAPSEVGQSISRKGEDVKPGDVVLTKGRRIRPQDIGLMKAIGTSRIRVVRKPRVGILSTGNELTDMPRNTQKGKIVDINRTILSRMVQELGGFAVDLGIVRDYESEIMTVLRRGVKSCDAVMVIAGSSVGEKDLVSKCIARLGKPGVLVHGIAMRPAMPTGLAVVNSKPILSLPGFPISSIFAFRVFGRPLIARLLGTEPMPDPTVKATLKERVTNSPGFRTFIRVMLTRTSEGLFAEPLKVQRSSVTMSVVSANGILTLNEETPSLDVGQEVTVEVIGEILSRNL
jgi:molybdopterin molybdotransferase